MSFLSQKPVFWPTASLSGICIIFRPSNVISIYHSITNSTLTLCWKEQMNNTTKTWTSKWIFYDQNWSTSFYVSSCKLGMFCKWQKTYPKTFYFHKKSNRSLIFIKLLFSAKTYCIFCSTFRLFPSGFLKCHGSISALRSLSSISSPGSPLPSLSPVHLSPEVLFLCLQRLTGHTLLWGPCPLPLCSTRTVEGTAGPTLHNATVSESKVFDF